MGYLPNAMQAVIHKDQTDTVLVAGGWRGGKSVVVAAEAVPHCLIPSPRPYLLALIGPTYLEPRAEFDYMVEFLDRALPHNQFNTDLHVSRPKEGKCEFTIPDQAGVHFATVRTYTASEAVNIRSFNADAVIICEAGGIDKEAFDNIVGRVLSTGGFILGSGTMESAQKWYHDKIKAGRRDNDQGIKSFTLPSWTNTAVFAGGESDPKILRAKALLDPETFAVRIGAEPVRVQGVALRQLTPAHIQDVQFDSMIPVELWIDPGHTGAYSVLAIQRYDNEVRIIDEVYERFLGTPDVIAICRQREWWGNVDASNPGVIDRAAKQKQAVTGTSVLDVWYEEAGMWLAMTEQVIPVEDGLEQARNHLAMSGHVVVSPKCHGFIAECDLGDFPEGFENNQPWHYRTGRDGNFVGDRALTGADHSCTAFIYGLVYNYGYLTMDAMTDDFSPRRLIAIHGSKGLNDEYGAFTASHMGSIRD